MRLCLVKQPDEIGPDSNSGPEVARRSMVKPLQASACRPVHKLLLSSFIFRELRTKGASHKWVLGKSCQSHVINLHEYFEGDVYIHITIFWLQHLPVEGDPPAALVILGDEQDGSTLCKIPDMRRSTHESSWICPPRNDVVQSGLK
ncbi:hypothetical protein Plhal304r1_c005g0021851 [Plasmopara halstedii]